MLVDLERRIGQTFTLRELVAEYEASEAWCQRLAHELAPEQPWAWDMSLVQDAGFHRYARRAIDYRP